MKKVLSLFMVLLLAISLFACGKEEAKQPTIPALEEDHHVQPPKSISVRSLAELNEMRDMINCTDEEVLTGYLRSVEGGGADSVADLEEFIKLYDILPKFDLMGDITWVAKFDEAFFITTTDEEGNGFMVQYQYRKQGQPLDLTTSEGILTAPIKSADGKVTIYTETRTPLESGVGESIRYRGTLNNIPIFIKYIVRNDVSVNTAQLFSTITVQDPAAAVK